MIEKLKKQLKEVQMLQYDLMDIENYSEDIYQAYQRLIDELEEAIED